MGKGLRPRLPHCRRTGVGATTVLAVLVMLGGCAESAEEAGRRAYAGRGGRRARGTGRRRVPEGA